MKRHIAPLVALVLALTTQDVFSQVQPALHKSFSLGILAGEYGYDMGVGVELGTPCLFKNRISFRIKANRNWLEPYNTIHGRWARYETISTSMVYNMPLTDRARLYFEVGTYYIFPDNKFSDRKIVPGITSSVGVELFVFTSSKLNICYYFSGGIGYVHAHAEKLENEPHYGNGFIFNNGFRFYF
jgi:hypothetical protein